MNATKHGERSSDSRAAWRELNAATRALSKSDRDRSNMLEAFLPADANATAGEWADRIADELCLLGVSGKSILAHIRSTT